MLTRGAARRPTVTVADLPQRGDARAIQMPHCAAGVPVARWVLVADVAPRTDEDTAAAAAVVASELLANSVQHARARAGGVVTLRWQVRGGVVDLEVTDGGAATVVRPLRAGAYASHGRGLRIVRSLAHEWGVHCHDNGHRTVWAALGGPTRRRRRDA